MYLLQEIMFSPGIRPYNDGHPMVAVVLTDGKATNGDKTQAFAQTVRWNEFILIAKKAKT